MIKKWGKFKQFILNKKSTVKILHIKKGKYISLQYHNKRQEYWYIISGTPLVLLIKKLGKYNNILCDIFKPNDELIIKKKEVHQIKAIDKDCYILEISTGIFDENDIVRLDLTDKTIKKEYEVTKNEKSK